MFALFFYKMSKLFRKIKPINVFFKQLNLIFNGVVISDRAEIGKNFDLVHGVGTVIGACKIGNNVRIYQNVTLGSKRQGEDITDFPTVEDNVIIFAGAIILGRIRIGKKSVIGAGSFVDKDIPQNSVVYNEKKVVIKKPNRR
jgi:serine O-acetyltransferase